MKFKILGIKSVLFARWGLKKDVLPTNSCVTNGFNLHIALEIALYTVSCGAVPSYSEPLTAYEAHTNT